LQFFILMFQLFDTLQIWEELYFNWILLIQILLMLSTKCFRSTVDLRSNCCDCFLGWGITLNQKKMEE
jgi:hypothetical protein